MSRHGAAIHQLIRRELGPTFTLPRSPSSTRPPASEPKPCRSRAKATASPHATSHRMPSLACEAKPRSAAWTSRPPSPTCARCAVPSRNSSTSMLSFDNSLPHLLTDADLLTAFREFMGALRPGGIVLCSVRDYERIDRARASTHPYGTRWRGGVQYQLPPRIGPGAMLRITVRRWSSRRSARTTGGRSCGR